MPFHARALDRKRRRPHAERLCCRERASIWRRLLAFFSTVLTKSGLQTSGRPLAGRTELVAGLVWLTHERTLMDRRDPLGLSTGVELRVSCLMLARTSQQSLSLAAPGRSSPAADLAWPPLMVSFLSDDDELDAKKCLATRLMSLSWLFRSPLCIGQRANNRKHAPKLEQANGRRRRRRGGSQPSDFHLDETNARPAAIFDDLARRGSSESRIE